METKYIDTEKFSQKLRSKGIDLDSKKILMSNFKETKQNKDLTLPSNCNGFGRIHHFKSKGMNGFPLNPLPIVPAEKYLQRPLGEVVKVQVFQNAICSWRCWYCYVDFSLLSGDPKHSSFMTADELIDLYLKEEERCLIIDLSGGQPDLVPELSLWFADALHKRGMSRDIFLWSDDNLSNDYLWRYLSKEELHRLASYQNYSRVGCFKGFDKKSFSFNTKAEPELFHTQFQLMNRLIKEGFDVYGYITLTSPDDSNLKNKIADLIDIIQNSVHPLFPLRTVPLQIFKFTPTASRMNSEHERSIEIQKEAVLAWNEEISKRYSVTVSTKKIVDHIIN
ncbi:hypothetical protein GO755_37050 [Spirosoma sp. HMF4905]|uniref:Radical SAM protein n=1 Tax=Spirosoma arboris TaxID=2682092 RepID=A0A7K1SPD9_9BACT|nr:hypothetical protein [Spirosoma arboris]MVM35682.1 hypothetical protein [Spirosoma arboris]